MGSNLNIKCLQCEKQLSEYDSKSDTHNPTPETLIDEKKVAVPNLVWFCSQICGNEFESEKEVVFQRDENNKILLKLKSNIENEGSF